MIPGAGRPEATDSFSDTLDEGREDSLLSGKMLDDGIGGICEPESMTRIILSANYPVSKRSVEIIPFKMRWLSVLAVFSLSVVITDVIDLASYTFLSGSRSSAYLQPNSEEDACQLI